MDLIIYKSDNIDYQYAVFLKYVIIRKLQLNLFSNKNKLFNIYLNNTLNSDLTVEDIIKFSIKNISITQTDDRYIIGINKRTKIENYNLEKLCRLINFGATGIRGLYYFSEIYNYIRNNSSILHQLYLFGVQL